MSYLGNTPTQQGFIPAIDFFSGNGITTAFTLSRPVASVAQVQATIENVPQNPGTAFTVSGNTITFDGAPASGTNNIYVYYTSPITQVIQPGQGTVSPSSLSTGGPVWNTSGNLGVGTSATTYPLTVGNNKQIGGLNTSGSGVTFAIVNGSNNLVFGDDSVNTNTLTVQSRGGTVFNVNLLERMRIDSSGRVTMPFQPSFRATTTTGGSYPTSGGNTINFNNVGSNIGNHFATSGGNAYKRFTAPVAGQYLFTASLMGNTGSGRYYFNLSKNGANFAQSGGSANDYGNFTIAVVVDMAVNDYMEVYLQSGTLYSASTSENYFSGYLLG